MARYRKRLFNGRRSYSKYRRYSKYRKSQFRGSSKYKRVSRFLRRYKKYGGKRFFRAQRPYQKTRYRINNIIAPDELVMDFKWNQFSPLQFASSHNIQTTTFPVFGINSSYFGEVKNFNENAMKYKQVEFLSGKLTMYIFNNSKLYYRNDTVNEGEFEESVPTTAMVAYQTARTWTDQSGQSVSEALIPMPALPNPNPTGKTRMHLMWEEIAEMGRVSCKFISNGGGSKISQKLKFNAKQSTFKSLKADRTGFQLNIPEPASGAIPWTTNVTYPQNSMFAQLFFLADAHALIPDENAQTLGTLQVFTSYRFKVKFKGLRSNML